MAAQLLDEGLAELFDAMTGASGVYITLEVALFTNNPTLGPDLVYSDFTQPVDAGAAAQPLVTPWGDLTPSGGAITGATQPPLTWVWAGTPSESYYGYVVYNSATHHACWAEKFTSPFPNTGACPALVLYIDADFGDV